MDRQAIETLLRKFPLGEWTDFEFQRFGAGLIHQTFLIQIGVRKFILQGFNSNVFKHPDRIEQNLSLLLKSGDLSQLPFQIPLPILNRDLSGLTAFQGHFYRLFDFVEGQTMQQILEPRQARQAAEAYALFSVWADDFPLELFEETIPDFHCLDLRFDKLTVLAKSVKSLNPEEQQVLDFYLSQKDLIEAYLQITSVIPKRLTHNDTKINNLIFSSDLTKVAAVIDLDTIMPGYLLYDFGDLVRTVASAEEETSQAWDKQRLLLPIFENLLLGYWNGAGDLMSEKEAKSLLIGGEVMACLMGVRFLTDYLEGNVYYQITYPSQNFHRAKNQMILLQSMQESRSELSEIFSSITGIRVDS